MAWPETLLHNWRWKLFSLILATIFWVFIHTGVDRAVMPFSFLVSAERSVVFKGLPITVMAQPGEAHRYQLRPAAVDVTVSGQAGVLQGLTRGDIRVFVDVSSAETGGTQRKVRVLAPGGIQVLRITPDEVFVESVAPTEPRVQ